eukprot:TCONS_00041423-protein
MSMLEADIRENVNNLPKSLTGAQGFVSTKSFISLEMTQWSVSKLKDTLATFHYEKTNLLSMMTLSVEHFHATTHTKHVLMTQLQYSREFMRSVKESLKRGYPWSAYYFTNRKGSWYPLPDSFCNFNEINKILPPKNLPTKIEKRDEETLQNWATNYTRAVRQRTVRQETTMCKMGTMPHYVYTTSEIEETAKQTVPYKTKASEAGNVEEEKEEEEIPDRFDESSDDDFSEDDEENASDRQRTDENIIGLDRGSLF